jgi:hypothetical protein
MNPISGRAGDLSLIRSSISWGDRVATDVGIASPKTRRNSWFGTFGPLVIQRRLVLTAAPWAVLNIVSAPLRRHPARRKADHRFRVSSAMALTRWIAVATSSATPSPIYDPNWLTPHGWKRWAAGLSAMVTTWSDARE